MEILVLIASMSSEGSEEHAHESFSPEPSLLTNTKNLGRKMFRHNFRHLSLWIHQHGRFKETFVHVP